MKFSDRPPMASDLSCDHDRNNDEEDFRRQMSQPLLPPWNDLSDEPCLCIARYIFLNRTYEPDLIAVWKVPCGPMMHLLQCPRCGHRWKKVVQADSDCTDNPAKK